MPPFERGHGGPDEKKGTWVGSIVLRRFPRPVASPVSMPRPFRSPPFVLASRAPFELRSSGCTAPRIVELWRALSSGSSSRHVFRWSILPLGRALSWALPRSLGGVDVVVSMVLAYGMMVARGLVVRVLSMTSSLCTPMAFPGPSRHAARQWLSHGVRWG